MPIYSLWLVCSPPNECTRVWLKVNRHCFWNGILLFGAELSSSPSGPLFSTTTTLPWAAQNMDCWMLSNGPI
jgi:hypothetical protein